MFLLKVILVSNEKILCFISSKLPFVTYFIKSKQVETYLIVFGGYL